MSNENMITVNNYFKYLAEKKLMASKCPHCNQIDLPPRRLCSECLSEAEWIELSGKGALKTFSSIYVGSKAMMDKGYNRKKPYVFAVCQMEEGPSVAGQLIGVDETQPDKITIDMAVQVTFLRAEIGVDKEGNPLYRWDVGFEPQK
ncbi:hypothetical protein NEF87_002605 [Candidatus Lokiarchaeum ossiferum]|uniref:Zn-ribbon domain-containing OB-fold protein n=1 Tax=Candidatus Lokiarchaeum ossiferum TaxID=2951803 RepID=A0ABY6HS31_9ARCH|nr:hypothetical protein NEF87_002605 [Candidatus Lokiarchaeum sp. B-35]